MKHYFWLDWTNWRINFKTSAKPFDVCSHVRQDGCHLTVLRNQTNPEKKIQPVSRYYYKIIQKYKHMVSVFILSIAFLADMEEGEQETNDLSLTTNSPTPEEGSYVSQSQLAAREVAKAMAPVVESNPAAFQSGNPQNLRNLIIKLSNQDPEKEKDVAR